MKSRLLLSLMAVSLAAAASLGQTYRKIAPLPTGYSLSGMAFSSPSTRWIVGDQHTILKSTDSGVTWSEVVIPGFQSDPFYAVFFVNDQAGFISGNSGQLQTDVYRTLDGGTAWQTIAGFPYGSWRYIDFVNASTGFMGANGALARTMDGGANWATQSAYPDCPIVYGMDFVNADKGLVGGYQISSQQGGIFRTVDGGLNWQNVRLSNGSNDAIFLTDTIAIADESTAVLRSTDAGNTWAPVGFVPTGLMDMEKLDASTVVGVSAGGDVWRSGDGGFTWSLRWVGEADLPADWSVEFRDASNGYVVGLNGAIYESTDGGMTWIRRNRGIGNEWNGIVAFSDDAITMAGFHGFVMSTSDAGAHWTPKILDRPTFGRDTSFSDLCLTGPDGAYAVGHWGSMFKSNDRGTTWMDLSSSVNQSYYANAVTFTDENNGWLAGFDYNTGPKVYVRRTFDGGITWQGASLNVPSVDVEFSGQTGYVLTTGPIYKSTDNGATWNGSLLSTPTGDPTTNMQMSWATPNVGYVCGFDGFIAKTTNGGTNWTRVVPEQSNFVYLDVKTVGTNEVWACGGTQGGGNAIIMRSLDGGATWRTWNLPGPYTMPNKIAITNRYAYVTGYSGETWQFDLASFTEFPPSSYSIYHGIPFSGGLQDLLLSDDTYLVTRMDGTLNRQEDPVSIIVSGTAPSNNPSDLRLQLEAHVSAPTIGQKIEFWDYQANRWVLITSGGATQVDSVMTAIGTSPGRFVQAGTNEVKARLSWKASGAQALPKWLVYIDQATWRHSP